MDFISTGFDGRPWPEFMADHRPILVVLAAPDGPLALDDGWDDLHGALALASPDTAWSAVLIGSHPALHRPGGLPWQDGEIAATRH
ncbi:hypothetical protein ACFC1R_38315 [Kitasatospora sp. NPDC056138]|uniref:hypothetical protein n=1 Tax=Kitasatospora sp. NPDC056138 TaxID=3345724 RepID=UPI0035DE8FDF